MSYTLCFRPNFRTYKIAIPSQTKNLGGEGPQTLLNNSKGIKATFRVWCLYRYLVHGETFTQLTLNLGKKKLSALLKLMLAGQLTMVLYFYFPVCTASLVYFLL
jgi:hypothetical protein